MAISSVGYAGTIDDANWRRMATATVGSLYGVDDYSSWRVSPGVGDRAVQIAPGGAFGLGVRDVSTAPEPLSLAPIGSGSRWDLIAAHRNWSTKTTTPIVITGSATKQIPSRAAGFDGLDDQPLALARVTAGQSTVQEIVDLRCIPGDGGLLALDDLARSYLDRVGTQVRIGNLLWSRTIDNLELPQWSKTDVTPDTGWLEIGRNGGWSFSWSQVRRIGGTVFLRVSASRPVGWSLYNQLAAGIPESCRPASDWYVASSARSGKREFVILTDGQILASENSSGTTDLTITTSYPAASVV